MTYKIRPKRSNVASKVPLATDLDIGELAINMADQKIYTKTPSNTVVELGGGGTTLPADASGYLVNDGAGALSWAAGDGTFSGDYDDLTNKPTIPTDVSDLTDTTSLLGGGNTGNVTFNDINIIGTGNLNLQPDPADAAAYVNIYLTGAADIHMAAGAAGANLILGTDEEANVAVLQGGNVAIQAGNVAGTKTWTFDTAGNLTLPLNSVVYETNIPDGALSGSAIALKPAGGTTANQQLLIYPTAADGDHIHMTSGNLYATELFLGSDNFYVKLANTGNVIINSNDGNSSNAMWTFSNDGTTTFPTGNITSNTSLQFTTTFANVKTVEYQTAGVWDLYVEDSITGSNTASSRLNVTFKDNLIDKPQVYIENTKESDGIALRWTFDENGNLTLPAGGDIKDSTGNSVLGGGSGASGFTKVSVLGQDDVFASEAGNELALVAGEGIAITTNDSDGTVTISASGSGLEAPYKGFRAHYGTMYNNTDDENGPINKLVIYKDTVSPTSAIDTDTSSDDFQVTGLTGSDVVAMLVVVTDGTDWDIQTPTATLKTFVEKIIDEVILDEGVEGDVNTVSAMKSAFYNNFSNFGTVIPNPKVDLVFFDINNQFTISPTFTTGDGASFSGISYNMDNDTLDLGSWGQGAPNTHEVNDVHVIPGNTIQDANGNFLLTPDNDVTVTITGVSGGAILNYTVTGTLPRPAVIWPSTSISDGGDDEYDGANAIHTNLATEISYGGGNVVNGSSAFGGGDYVVAYQAGIFGIFAVDASIDIIGTSGDNGGYGNDSNSSGFDGDGVAVTGSLYGDSAPAVTISEITNTSSEGSIYSVSVGTDGVVTMTTSRGGLEFGALPEPGGPSHFHIMRAAGQTQDLYFGDDYNYVLQRATAYDGAPGYGVEIGANDRDGGDQHVWRFGTDGNLTLPVGGDILDSTGTSVLGGGTTLPADASGYLVNDGAGALSWAAGDGTFSGDYDDLTNKPTIPADISDLTDTTNLLFSGSYNDLSNTPSLFSGDYDDLTSKPTLFDGAYSSLTGTPSLFSGDYDDLTSKPTLFDGNYNSLTNKPTYKEAVSAGTGPGGNNQADSLVLAGLNPTENIPSTYGGDLILKGGYGGANNDLFGEVRIKSGTIGSNFEWHFTVDKKIKLPSGGSIVDSTGANVFVSLTTLKQLVADSTDFADFKSRIANM